MKQLEEERKKGTIGSPLEAQVILKTDDAEFLQFVKDAADLLPSIFIVSGRYSGRTRTVGPCSGNESRYLY